MSDFYEDGENWVQGYRGGGHNKLGLRDREDEKPTMPHNTPGARGHIVISDPTFRHTKEALKAKEKRLDAKESRDT